MPWKAIGLVSSGLTLVAFIVAVSSWAYRRKLLQTERLIKSAPEEKRGELVNRVLEAVDVDTAGLTRHQRYELSLRLIEGRSRRFFISALVVVIVAILTATLAAYAISQVSKKEHTVKEDPESIKFGQPLPFDTGWIFTGYYDTERNVYTEGPMARIALRPTNSTSGDIPEVGDVLEIIKQRNVVIADYRTAGLRNQMTSPAYVKEEISDEDRTGIKLDEGKLVIVRDVEVSGIGNRPSSIWCRIASCEKGLAQCQQALKKLIGKPQ